MVVGKKVKQAKKSTARILRFLICDDNKVSGSKNPIFRYPGQKYKLNISKKNHTIKDTNRIKGLTVLNDQAVTRSEYDLLIKSANRVHDANVEKYNSSINDSEEAELGAVYPTKPCMFSPGDYITAHTRNKMGNACSDLGGTKCIFIMENQEKGTTIVLPLDSYYVTEVNLSELVIMYTPADL
jgi:hypothetical protein